MVMGIQVEASELSGYDFHYAVSGDAAVAPVQVFDDGQYLYLQFKSQVDIPAVFIHAGTGMVRRNVHPEFPYFVLNNLSPEVVLKFGGKQAVVTYTGGRALVDGGQSHGAVQTGIQNTSASIPKDTFRKMNASAIKQINHFSGELIFVQNTSGTPVVTAPCTLTAPVAATTPRAVLYRRVPQHHTRQNHRGAGVAATTTSQPVMGKENQK
uniref:Uncharacterized protein n=1 Tax=mine drainage metagenome TaxID=410659 RepID=E6QVE1_9ZZZZ